MKFERLAVPAGTRFLKSGRVTLFPGESVGEHNTGGNEEIIIVLKGKATVRANGSMKEIKPHDFCFIGRDTFHDVKNNSEKSLEYTYVVGKFS
jgi:quercetin dioxygenase-like cupin family protein